MIIQGNDFMVMGIISIVLYVFYYPIRVKFFIEASDVLS